MYPLVESVDLCIFHPVHAVTAHDKSGLTKRKSVIQLGDMVFCKPQPHGLYYAHLVLEIDALTHAPVKFTIGDIKGHKNGQCFEDHIFGIAGRPADFLKIAPGPIFNPRGGENRIPHAEIFRFQPLKQYFDRFLKIVIFENLDFFKICSKSRF